MNILIVEDNQTNLKLLHAELEAEGHAIYEAHDGVEALELLEQQPVDAVISDLLMPRMDGYRLCHEIRKSDRLRHLPIIIYTATYTSPSDEKLALDVGADKYLKKPAPVAALIATLGEAVAAPHAARRPGALHNSEVLKEYSERLVAKLEAKNIELAAIVESYNDLFDNTNDLIQSTTPDGHFLYVNRSWRETLGYGEAELPGLTLFNIIHPDSQAHCQALFQRVMSGERLDGIEATLVTKNRRAILVEGSASCKMAEGRGVAARCIFRDVTEQKRLQAQTLRAQRLESIGTLAGGVAHDLNNALAPIMIITELLRQDASNEAAQNIDIITASTKRAADMVKQLLTFAKGAEGERLLVQPHILIKEIEKIIKVSFPKSIEFHVRCPKDLPPILGDATQIHQVLLNLCVNARDAMPDGGTLTLKAENIQLAAPPSGTVGEFKPGSYVACSVMDTGTGIPPAILDRIFDPFFSTKPSDKGTGLGLSTVLGILKSHGGFLQVSSTPGDGSIFTFFVPPAETGEADVVSPTSFTGTFHGHGDLVLVVDDEAPLRKLLRTVLTKLNFKVTTAANGTDALVQAAEQRAGLRLVITDINMPHMDGLQFVRALKFRLPNVKIIVTSGKTDESVAEEFNKLGITSILEKPFRPEKLVATLKDVLTGT